MKCTDLHIFMLSAFLFSGRLSLTWNTNGEGESTSTWSKLRPEDEDIEARGSRDEEQRDRPGKAIYLMENRGEMNKNLPVLRSAEDENMMLGVLHDKRNR